LDKEVIKSKKFKKRNPNMNPNKACFYVGQTANDPNIRFKQHKNGYKSNSFVRKYGLSLQRRRYKRYNPIESRGKAEKIEKELTEKLRRKGHGVWSN
jgi:predicted GIY-YIG superfamily endonuclease